MNHPYHQSHSLHLPDRSLQSTRKDTIGHLLHICALGYFHESTAHKAVRPEPLDEVILIYCCSGKGYYIIDGKETAVSPGEWFVIPAGCPHEYGNYQESAWSILWVHFAGTFAENLCRHLVNLPGQGTVSQSKLEAIFSDMFIPLAAGWNMANTSLANHVLWHFLGEFTRSTCIGLPTTRSTGKSVAERIIDHFTAHLAAPHSLQTLADLVNLSPSHLSACFKDEVGSSPIDYLIRMRILEAVRLLESTHLRIGEIAEAVGYPDAKFFSKTFRRTMGLSPRDYRHRHTSLLD